MRRSNIQTKRRRDTNNFKRLYWILGSLFGIAIFLIFFVIGDYGLYQIYQLHKQKNSIETNIDRLKGEQDSLRRESSRLESDLKYIEKLARERYRMARKGEKVFRVLKSSKSKDK